MLTRPKYVPSERVVEIREGLISLDLAAGEAAELEPYKEHVEKPLADLAPPPPPTGGRRGGGPFGAGGGGLMRILFGRRW